jgi:hypothetical protein
VAKAPSTHLAFCAANPCDRRHLRRLDPVYDVSRRPHACRACTRGSGIVARTTGSIEWIHRVAKHRPDDVPSNPCSNARTDYCPDCRANGAEHGTHASSRGCTRNRIQTVGIGE